MVRKLSYTLLIVLVLLMITAITVSVVIAREVDKRQHKQQVMFFEDATMEQPMDTQHPTTMTALAEKPQPTEIVKVHEVWIMPM